MKTLLVLVSYHHRNTEKIAKMMAAVLDASIKTAGQINTEELGGYDLIGFGSGIYSSRHDQSIFDLVDKLPRVNRRQSFVFSTCGAPAVVAGEEFKRYVEKNHAPLIEKLQDKGYVVIAGFGCRGLNTNSFLKYFGGLNKGRPNSEDLQQAEEFAQNLKLKFPGS